MELEERPAREGNAAGRPLEIGRRTNPQRPECVNTVTGL